MKHLFLMLNLKLHSIYILLITNWLDFCLVLKSEQKQEHKT